MQYGRHAVCSLPTLGKMEGIWEGAILATDKHMKEDVVTDEAEDIKM